MTNSTNQAPTSGHTTDTTPFVLTRREAAQRYRMSLRQLDSLLRADVIPQLRIGRSVRIPVQQADEAILSFAVGRAADQSKR